MKKNAAFALISFAVLKWHECLSFQLPFELTVELPVQLHLELEVNLLVRNVIEREIERENVQMKPPKEKQVNLLFQTIFSNIFLIWNDDPMHKLKCCDRVSKPIPLPKPPKKEFECCLWIPLIW